MSRDLSAKPVLLVVGAALGAAAALVATARPAATGRGSAADGASGHGGRTGGRLKDGQDQASTTSALLTGDHRWGFETSAVVHRPAGEVALHLHEHVDLPGLRGPLDGPPMDRVEWSGPGGTVLRLQIHGLPGGTSTEIMFQAAPDPSHEDAPIPAGLEAEGRRAVAALRKEIER